MGVAPLAGRTLPGARRLAGVHFGAFELDLRTLELRRSGVLVRLQPQPARALALLARRAGDLVTREEIRAEVWDASTFVDFDQGLNFCVRQIRGALGDQADAPRYLETLPRRGYRFVAPVKPIEETAGEAPRFPRVMLAVLPFESLSPGKDPRYFSDGLTEETITRLARLEPERLGVIARTSTSVYRNAVKSVEEVGRELGVDYVLEGSVRHAGERLRVTAQLIQVRDQSHLWAESYERRGADALDVQDEVARRIVAVLEARLLGRALPSAEGGGLPRRP